MRKGIVMAWIKPHRFVLLLAGIWLLTAMAVLLFVSSCAEQAPAPTATEPAPTAIETVPPTPEPALATPTIPGPKELAIRESPFSDMACKKVIIRNDDVGHDLDAALIWLSDLVVSKDIKATYAVMPYYLSRRPESIDFLNKLDKEHFEMATHGYAHTDEKFGEMTYDEQYSLMKQGTELIKELLHVTPYTFIPPYSSDNIHTTKVCKDLGYHSISTMRKYPISYIPDFAMIDFSWEYTYRPLTFNDYEVFQKSFNSFYYDGQSKSQDEFYVICMHVRAWCTGSGCTGSEEQAGHDVKRDFEKSIDYMKSKDVEFMTVEEAYYWYIDEPYIKVGKINETAYYIDLSSCQYDHTISFHCPPNWGGSALIRDASTGEITQEKGDIIKFHGIKEHYYEILPVFMCSSLVISSDEVSSGESLEVSVTVTNTSDAASSCQVVLKINRTGEATQEVTLGAGAAQQVSFKVARDIAETYIAYKTYVVNVNGLTGSFVVKRN